MPLLWLWHDARPGRAPRCSASSPGSRSSAFHLSWTWYFGAVAIVPLVALQAAFWARGRRGRRHARAAGIRSPFLTAAVWVVFEAIRTRWPLGGLAWGQLGVALHDFGFGPRARELGRRAARDVRRGRGERRSLADIVRAARAHRRRTALVACVALGGIVVVVAVGDGRPASTRDRAAHCGYALLQGNDKDRYLTQAEIDPEYLTRSHLALAARLHGHYDLIVFPESSLEHRPRDRPGAAPRARPRSRGSTALVHPRQRDRRR